MPVPVILRPYQNAAVEGARNEVASGGSPVIEAPTGSGKTTIAADIIKRAVAKSNAVLFLAHRSELLTQARNRLASFGVDAAVIAAGMPVTSAPVNVASMQTLTRRKRKPAANLIIIDEAHRVRARSYENILSAYPGIPVVGLTATPVRTDGRGLGDVFTKIVSTTSALELIEDGYLMAPTYYSTRQPDFSGVKHIGGEFDQSGAGAVMSRPNIVGDVVDHFTRHHVPGFPGLTFACSIAHSIRLHEAYLARGINALRVDGKTPKAERESIMAALNSGTVDVVVNVDVATEGLDAHRIGIVQLCRPTESFGLHRQMLGRVVRMCEGKTKAVVLDHVGNLTRHGFMEDLVEWSLEDKPRKKGEVSKAKTCPRCLCANKVTATHCVLCGHLFPVRTRSEIAEEAGELVEVKPTKATNEEKAAEMDRLLGVARGLGYFRKWAAERYTERFKVRPRGSWYRPLINKHLEACTHVRRTSAGWCRFCHEGMAEEDKPTGERGKPRW